MSHKQLYNTLKKLARKREIKIHECELPKTMYGFFVSATDKAITFVDRDVSMFGVLVIETSNITIFIDKGIPMFQKVLTLTHQLGHYMLHRNNSKIMNSINADVQFRESNEWDYNLLCH